MRQNFKQHRTRRTYDNRFKAELVSESINSDKSVATIALENDINANVLHRWLNEHERYGHHDIADFDVEPDAVPLAQPDTAANWLAITPAVQSLPEPQPKRTVRLKKASDAKAANHNVITDGTVNITVKSAIADIDLQWSSADYSNLAMWLKEMLK